MHQPDAIDIAIVEDRAREYRDQVARRLTGEITEDQFKPLRLMNGLYLQLHAYMLRVAVPFGGYSAAQMRVLADIARRYDRHYAHVTTRQNFQFNWIKLKDTPDILDALAAVGLHAIQTSGSCVRAITADPMAGFARDEVADPRHLAEAIRRWTSLHPEFTYLPRKFKIAITGSPHDRSSLRVHDLGIELVREGGATDGALGARIWAGGGLGRGPAVGIVVVEFSPLSDVLGWVEAILRVYNAGARRDHLYKSRIKVQVASMGADAFRAAVETEFARAGASRPVLTEGDWRAAQSSFIEPTLTPAPDQPAPASGPFARWVRRMTIPHRVSGHVGVHVSLKRPGGIPGDIDADQMDALADLAERWSHGELRNTQNQNIILPHVRQTDLPDLFEALDSLGLATPNIGLASDIVSCPGMDYCQLADARSIPLAQALGRTLADLELDEEVGPLSIKVSGCVNACAHHHVADIGILGVDKTDTDHHQILVGGVAGEGARLAQSVSRTLTTDETIAAVERILRRYLDSREGPEETFASVYRRLGPAPFKEAVDAAAVG